MYVSGFRFDWATPNAIRWAWKLEGLGEDLASYELELQRDTDPQVARLTSADLTELGSHQLRRSNGFDVLTGVITPDLRPSSLYTARLRVNGVNGKSWVSSAVRGSTDAPRPVRLTVFDDALPLGAYTLPDTLRPVATGGFAGGPSLEFKVGPGLGYENLRVSGLGLQADQTLTDKLFASAYLELWVRGRGAATSAWSELWVRFLPQGQSCPTINECIFSFPGQWVYRPDPAGAELRRVQVPLSAFKRRTNAAEPLNRAMLLRAIDEVNVGLPFLDPTDEVHLDRITLSW